MIILPLDPHLVDASVNFEDLGYLQFFIANCVFGLRLSLTFIPLLVVVRLFRGFRLSSVLKIFVGECKIIVRLYKFS